MSVKFILITLLAILFFGFIIGRARSIKVATETKTKSGRYNLHSRPYYYGYMIVLWAGIPSLLILLLWTGFDSSIITSLMTSDLSTETQALSKDERSLVINKIISYAELGKADANASDPKLQAAAHYLSLKNISEMAKTVVVFALAILGIIVGLRFVKPEFRARNQVEKIIRWIMIACASIAIFTTFGIVLSVLFEALQFFKSVHLTEFLFGTHWNPQTAIREDQVGGSGSFGSIPLFTGTLLISAIALTIAVPTGLMTAIYLSEYASQRLRSIAKPVLEILAGIPTVVYGFFAALTVAPFIRETGEAIGLHPSSESALAAGIVMGIMIIPFVSSLSDDVISAVPQAMRDGSYAMGATQSETIRKVVIPAALPGIVGGVLLAASRAIGETMIVVMAAGLAANLTANPLEAVTTVTVQIVTLLTGDQEFDSPKTLAAFALGLGLFTITLILNVISLHVVRKYREQYE
ncbi:MAG TPA: phosphate ABC transporter permease subunit PstC [Leucothrix sp.]|nr:phosphate ABC transporter permease subunit PstC [Leucothrix sp.]HIQ14722.1 phosphate ABC transporter permease subunit PstC [Leucothrix sp.]